MLYKKRCSHLAKFIGKHLYKSLFRCNFIKKETLAQVFSYEFCEIFKNIFFTEHLRATALIQCIKEKLSLAHFTYKWKVIEISIKTKCMGSKYIFVINATYQPSHKRLERIMLVERYTMENLLVKLV